MTAEQYKAIIRAIIIPGRIVKILVDVGAVVKKDQVLFVLEAMKMENRLLSPVSGKKVKEIKVVKGQSIMTDEVPLNL